MEFVKVESSQIDSVGFGDGEFGPETLGVRFKSKSGLTEYHYQNVTPRRHRALMAADSVGAYFGKEIKNKPEYPLVKVEADPTTPANGVANITQAVQSAAKDDALNPSSDLALIDTMADDLLFSPGAVTDVQLEAGRQWYLTEAKKYDISTDKARTELKRFARPLQKLRTGIEARAKELTGATKRKIAAIDSEKRRLVQFVGGVEDEVLSAMTAWEQEEEARKIALANTVKAIEGRAEVKAYVDIASLEAAIAEVEEFDVTTMQEYRLSAESAKAAVLMRLRPELALRKEREAERLELEKFRAESAARAEADRLAEQQRQEQARIDAAVEAAKAETRQEVIAELATPEVEIPPSWKLDMIAPQTAPDYLDCTSPKFEASIAAPQQAEGGIVETHEQRFHREAEAGLMGFASIDRQTAIRVLTAITKGQVPHITIGY